MKRELTPQEVIYKDDFVKGGTNVEKGILLEYLDIYKSIEEALSINKDGFNVYLVDAFSKDKLNEIMSHIDGILKKKDRPKDVCYVTLENQKCPKVLFLNNGYGEILEEKIEDIRNFYFDKVFNFYNSSINEEKQTIVEDVQKKRNDYIGGLIKKAKDEGFNLKSTTTGFAFFPLVEGETMSEEEFDGLEEDKKEDISSKAEKLKEGAEGILEELKDIELNSIEKLKVLLEEYFSEESRELRENLENEFKDNEEALDYVIDTCDSIEKSLLDCYTMSFEDDEDTIIEAIAKYVVNVVVNNKEYDHPRVIFEEDPSVTNLMGSIEYENHNGVYSTDVSLIKGGSMLEANEGCLILRLSSLLNNQGSYYYLRRALINNKINYDSNKGYFEFLSLNGLKPEAIPINVKVVIIGDYESFDILYNYDEDFRNIFKIRAEFNPYINIDEYSKNSVNSLIKEIIFNEDLLNITSEGINEIGKYLSRKASSRKKIYWDTTEISRILFLANNRALQKNKILIESDDVCNIVYKSSLIEKAYLEMYEEKKILADVNGSLVGCVNGLSVIDTGYLSFGKPLRITCVCYKGTGRIIDVQRESNLSGNIHNKSINILRGFLNKFLNPYEGVPVDFHISFEQIYGKIEGDSASVAEIISIVSALSKIPIKQNIALTGSLNQFGEVQPIGGVNEKIEGFFGICKALDTYKGKGVLIPQSNKDELILSPEVEKAVNEGEFKIYTMENINDAILTLMIEDGMSLEDVVMNIDNELKKYSTEK